MNLKNLETTWECPPLKGNTFLELFQALEQHRGGRLSTKDVMGFLEVKDAELAFGFGVEGKTVQDLMQEADDLQDYILGKYQDDDELLQAMVETWGAEGPLHFRLDTMLVRNMDSEEAEDGTITLSEEEDRRCQMLTDYILSCRGTRALSCTLRGRSTVNQIPANLSYEEREEYADLVYTIIANLLYFNGSLVLRISRSKCITVNGFRFKNGNVEIADIETAKRLCRINMNPMGHRKAEVLYQVPDLDLP